MQVNERVMKENNTGIWSKMRFRIEQSTLSWGQVFIYIFCAGWIVWDIGRCLSYCNPELFSTPKFWDTRTVNVLYLVTKIPKDRTVYHFFPLVIIHFPAFGFLKLQSLPLFKRKWISLREIKPIPRMEKESEKLE